MQMQGEPAAPSRPHVPRGRESPWDRMVREAEEFLGDSPSEEQVALTELIHARALKDGTTFNAAKTALLWEEQCRAAGIVIKCLLSLAGILLALVGFCFFSIRFMTGILNFLGVKNP